MATPVQTFSTATSSLGSGSGLNSCRSSSSPSICATSSTPPTPSRGSMSVPSSGPPSRGTSPTNRPRGGTPCSSLKERLESRQSSRSEGRCGFLGLPIAGALSWPAWAASAGGGSRPAGGRPGGSLDAPVRGWSRLGRKPRQGFLSASSSVRLQGRLVFGRVGPLQVPGCRGRQRRSSGAVHPFAASGRAWSGAAAARRVQSDLGPRRCGGHERERARAVAASELAHPASARQRMCPSRRP